MLGCASLLSQNYQGLNQALETQCWTRQTWLFGPEFRIRRGERDGFVKPKTPWTRTQPEPRLGLEPTVLFCFVLFSLESLNPVSGISEVQVLCTSARKEFIERQSDRQEIDLLREDACERCKQAGMEALPQRSYSFIVQGEWGAEKTASSFLGVAAPPRYQVRGVFK